MNFSLSTELCNLQYNLILEYFSSPPEDTLYLFQSFLYWLAFNTPLFLNTERKKKKNASEYLHSIVWPIVEGKLLTNF